MCSSVFLIFPFVVAVCPWIGKKSVWLRAAALEKKFGNGEALQALLKKAVTYCPKVSFRLRFFVVVLLSTDVAPQTI